MKKKPGIRQFLAVFFSVLLFFGFIRSAARAETGPIPVDVFWKQVSDTQAWLIPPHSPAEWANQARIWFEIVSVVLPDGQVVRVDTSEIVRGMLADPPDAANLKTYFITLAQAQNQWSQVVCGDCKASLLAQILARPEFNAKNQATDPVQQFFQQILDAIFKWLGSLLGGSAGPSAIPPQVFIVIISMLLTAILAFVFRDVLRGMTSEVELDVEAPGDEQILTAGLAHQKAVQLSESGNYRLAMRYLYLSALLLLDERGILRYNRSLTNREYLRQVNSQPELEKNLKGVVDEFDRVWYGNQGIDQDDYARYVEQVSAIEAIKK